jgi:hypothetical protein
MTTLSGFCRSFFTQEQATSLAACKLQGYDLNAKQDALDAVDILVKYKTGVHEFTDEIVEFWPLPKKVMQRYSFDDAEQLNEWLDGLS